MANQIKSSGAALQVTKPARAAGLVEENENGEATYLAEVRVFAFDQLPPCRRPRGCLNSAYNGLVVAAAHDTDSIYQAMDASVLIAGNDYQVQLPPAADAGVREGDNAPCQSAPEILVLSRDDGTAKGTDAARLDADLITIQNKQYL